MRDINNEKKQNQMIEVTIQQQTVPSCPQPFITAAASNNILVLSDFTKVCTCNKA